MSFLGGMKSGRRFWAVALSVIVGGALACKTDPAEMQGQVGDYIFDFLADGSLTGGVPAGDNTISTFAVAAIDLSRAGPDEFGRSTPGNRSTYCSDCATFGAGWDFTDWLSTAASDMRTPTLVENDVVQSGLGLAIGDSEEVGAAGVFNPFTVDALENLKPNQVYIVAFYRYALTVNGELDQLQTLAGQTVDQPDALVVDGGTGPAGDPTVPVVSFPTFVNYVPDANPYIMGNFTTDAAGVGAFDGIIDGLGLFYTDQSGDPPDAAFDSSIVARNDGTATALPRYNYVVILEGPATDAADAADNPQAIRYQIGQDAAVGGAPIENAYAGYPSAALPIDQLLGTNVAAGKADELVAAYADLANLAGTGVYQVWVWNEENGNIKSPSGTVIQLNSDGDTVTNNTGVSTFNSDEGYTTTFTTSDEIGDYTHIFLSIESGIATAPAAPQPMFAQYTDMAGDPADPFGWTFTAAGSMDFGSFNAGDPAVWAPNGRGEGGFWGTECNADSDGFCQGPTNFLDVVFRNLQLPPVGYFYEAWLVDTDGNPVQAGQLLGKQDNPDQMPPSLFDIDTDETLQNQWSDGALIVWSETITTLADIDPNQFYNMLEYRLQLIPKAAAEGDPGPTTVLGGITPDVMRDRAPEPEPAE